MIRLDVLIFVTKLTEKTISSKKIYEGKLFSIKKDEVQLPNQRTTIRECINIHNEVVGILAVTEENKMILVKQYRYPIGKTIIEIPAGKIDSGEEPVTCAFRELREETGYVASRMDLLSSFYTSPGNSNGLVHLFEAKELIMNEANPDEDEFVELLHFSKEEVIAAIQAGLICDAKTLLAIQYWNTKGK